MGLVEGPVEGVFGEVLRGVVRRAPDMLEVLWGVEVGDGLAVPERGGMR